MTQQEVLREARRRRELRISAREFGRSAVREIDYRFWDEVSRVKASRLAERAAHEAFLAHPELREAAFADADQRAGAL